MIRLAAWSASLCAAILIPSTAQGLALVRDSKSDYAIFHTADAPASVRTGAVELRHYIREATGAELQIVTSPAEKMICLGDGPAARKAGLTVKDLELEGFRVAVRDDDLYILGPDTPDGGMTPGGGVSNGTLNGVYTFIHDVLDVRWLMPGPLGDDVPKTSGLIVENKDVVQAPAFAHRVFNMTSGPGPDAFPEERRRWLARQRMGGSIHLSHGHAWRRAIPAALFAEHPEYFAMREGERIDPVNGPSKALFEKNPALAQNLLGLVKAGRYKLCTSNPGLVRAYADAVIREFDGNPKTRAYSLSPSDGGRFCECPACLALYEKSPHGDRSATPAILKFYNGVTEIVAQRHPDRLLCGYVYASYLYPPSDRSWRPHPNLVLVAALSKLTYGVGLFRPGMLDEYESLLKQWGSLGPKMAYYDMFCVLEEFHGKSAAMGAPNPVGLDVLKRVFPRLKRTCRMGVHMTAARSWGHGSALNYLVANLIWDPDADVDGLFDEFCERAYGKGGTYMKQLYVTIDRAVTAHCRTHRRARYVLTESMLRDVYAANYDRIASLFLQARAAAETPKQKHRVEMFGRNLVILNWCLRRRGMIRDDPESPFQRPGADVGRLFESWKADPAIEPMRVTWDQFQKRIAKAVVLPRHSLKFAKYWYFQPDPDDEGVKAGWFDPGFDVCKWNRIGIEDTWEDQGYGPPAYPGKGGYDGFAWYRLDNVTPLGKYADWRALIHLGAVDESCRVYVNGKLAAEFVYDPIGDPDSWEQPLELPLAGLRHGQPNTIAIRVHDSGGAGGIWRGAWIVFRKE